MSSRLTSYFPLVILHIRIPPPIPPIDGERSCIICLVTKIGSASSVNGLLPANIQISLLPLDALFALFIPGTDLVQT